MLRALVLLLVLVNLGLLAWHQGLLQGAFGIGPQAQREPERLSLQVRPDSVRVLTPQAASAVTMPPAIPLAASAASAPSPEASGPVAAVPAVAPAGSAASVP